MIRSTRSLLVALVAFPLSSAACTTDFDRFIGSGGGGTGGGTTTVTTTSTGGAGQGGSGGADPCMGVDCSDTNPCTDDTCVDGACPHGLDPNGTPTQTPNDCNVVVCVAGTPPTTMLMVDDLDLPVPGTNDCLLDTCVGGVPFPFAPQGMTCGTVGGVCNATGLCSACNAPIDCGTAGNCGGYTCIANTCGTAPTAAGTVISQDGTPGNCQSNVCDGTSLTAAVGDDDLDVATDVATDCVNFTCNSGNPGTTNDNLETCNDDAISGSEAGGQCSGGTCRDCTSNAGCDTAATPPHVCLGNNTCCAPMTLAMACAGKQCSDLAANLVTDGCGTTLNCGTCTAAAAGDDCVAFTCDCDNNNDCMNANADGTDCLNSDAGPCGCNMDNDCPSGTNRGERCVGAACGCAEATQGADCDASGYGRDCLATFVCGCTEANEATDCVGIGATPNCDAATGKCIP